MVGSIQRAIGGTLQSALAQPAVRNVLRNSPVSFRFGVVDPDCVLFVDADRRVVRFISADDGPNPMVAMTSATAIALCQGALDVSSALRSGEIVTSDHMDWLVELLNSVAALPGIYAAVAQREGRVDLLAS
jgi:hypothetical protein